MGISNLLGLLIGLLLIGFTLKKPKDSIALLFVLILSSPTYFAAWAFVDIGVNLYFIDFIIITLIFRTFFIKDNLNFKVNKISIFFLLWLIYGIFSVVYSVIFFNYEYSDILGFFRRFFFYPFTIVYILMSYSLELKKISNKIIQYLPLISCIVLILVCTRYFLGISYFGQEKIGGYDFEIEFRALSHIEAIGVLFPTFFYLSKTILEKKISNYYELVFLILGFVLAFMSGFRVVLGAILLGVIVLLGFFYKKNNYGFKSILQNSFYIIAVLILTITSYSYAFPDAFEIQNERYANVFTQGTISGIGWRYALWAEIINDFVKNPILGNGIGYSLDWYLPGSSSETLSNDPHNIILSLLVRLGVIGFVLFGIIQFYFFKKISSSLKKVTNPFLITILIIYLMLFFVGMLQPSIFGTDGATLYSLLLGFALFLNYKFTIRFLS